LNESDPQIVIEAILTDSLGYNFIKISKTKSLYQGSDFEKINNADVTVTDNNGNLFTFSNVSEGLYSNPAFKGTINSTYNLSVKVDDLDYTSSSKIHENVKIDSVSYFMFPSQFTGEMMIIANMYYTDPITEGNFYRIKTFVNNVKGEDNSFSIYSDEYINGSMSAFSYYSENTQIMDTVVFHLYTTDEANYEYWRILFTNSNMGMTSTPGNPTTNITGEDVIGYFGAYSMSCDTLIIIPIF